MLWGSPQTSLQGILSQRSVLLLVADTFLSGMLMHPTKATEERVYSQFVGTDCCGWEVTTGRVSHGVYT